MSMDNIKNLRENGMVIGSHAIKHKLMSRLSKKNLEQKLMIVLIFLIIL